MIQRLLPIFFWVSIFFTCSPSPTATVSETVMPPPALAHSVPLSKAAYKTINFKPILQGDWTSDRYIFSIKDNLGRANYPFLGFSCLDIQQDTLLIQEEERLDRNGNIAEGTENYQFRIHCADSLHLELITLDTFTKKRFWSDTLLLQKTLPQNPPSLNIQKIVFSSSTSEGPSPALDLEMFSDGNCFYKGRQNTQLDGYYEGSIDTTKFHFYEEKIRNVPISIFKQNTQLQHTDDWKTYLVIYLEGGEKLTRFFSPSQPEEDKSLQTLVHHLSNAYQDMQLKAPDINEEEHYFETYEKVH